MESLTYRLLLEGCIFDLPALDFWDITYLDADMKSGVLGVKQNKSIMLFLYLQFYSVSSAALAAQVLLEGLDKSSKSYIPPTLIWLF